MAPRPAERPSFHLSFPADLEADVITTWLRSVSGTLQTGPRRLLGVPSLVFEVRADEYGITYRLRAPHELADFLVPQLRTLIPGSTVMPAGEDERLDQWTAAVELGQTDSRRSLGAVNAEGLSASILANLQGLGRGEAVLLQWVVSPALRERPPALPRQRVRGIQMLMEGGGRWDEITDRRAKLSEPNFLGLLRVAVKSGSHDQDERLLGRVRASLASVGGASNRLKKRLVRQSQVIRRVIEAETPTLFPMQLAASELAALLAWPIGTPHVAGLPPRRTRHLVAAGSIPRRGRVIGRSNFPGAERLVALDYVESAKHLHVVGPTGSGKTALLANLIAQDMEAGRGVILIESKGDLFAEALARVPEKRVQDVVLLDVTDTKHPVGFNILQGSPYVVAADIQRLFDHLYPQDARGVRVRQGFYHLVLTLMMSTGSTEKLTFADIQPLAVPTVAQQEFSDQLIRGVSQVEELASWWDDIKAMPRQKREFYFKPLMDRTWQLTSRRSLRNIIGQSMSTVDLRTIIRKEKILLVNLGRGVEGKDTAGLLGSLLLNSVWSTVQGGAANPKRPTMLYLDEFQDFLALPIAPADMFAQARSLGLAMTVAHQYLGQLGRELQDATDANARSKVAFQSSGDEAKNLARGFGGTVTEDDLINLGRFEVIAKLATHTGVSSPLTAVTLPPVDETGFGPLALDASRENYGRPIADVEAEISRRRLTTPNPTAKAKRRFGGKAWNE
ncbi:type IV secretory system conjugative DNA transfer family protein [Streptomyces sp. NPDC101062]|uniref:type IV secretory system conjugative DNA transfer family protein n=1 Tax=unclassified Streptomyces TaxID=2593676 RepID=UPI003825F714